MSISSIGSAPSYAANPFSGLPSNVCGAQDAAKAEALSSGGGAVRGPVSASRPPERLAEESVLALLRLQEASHGAQAATQTGAAIAQSQSPLALAMQGVALTSLYTTKA